MSTMTFKTRLAKGGDPVVTEAEINWEGVTEAQKELLAARSVIIMAQATYRTSGVIPNKDTLNVSDLLKREKGGFKVTPESMVARINKMSPEEKAFIMNQLRGKH